MVFVGDNEELGPIDGSSLGFSLSVGPDDGKELGLTDGFSLGILLPVGFIDGIADGSELVDGFWEGADEVMVFVGDNEELGPIDGSSLGLVDGL